MTTIRHVLNEAAWALYDAARGTMKDGQADKARVLCEEALKALPDDARVVGEQTNAVLVCDECGHQPWAAGEGRMCKMEGCRGRYVASASNVAHPQNGESNALPVVGKSTGDRTLGHERRNAVEEGSRGERGACRDELRASSPQCGSRAAGDEAGRSEVTEAGRGNSAPAGSAPVVPCHDGAAMIAAERARQVEKEGYNADHDADHDDATLVQAALMYARHASFTITGQPFHPVLRFDGAPIEWPWEASDWKPKDPVRDLVRAGALIAAELDRLTGAKPAHAPKILGPKVNGIGRASLDTTDADDDQQARILEVFFNRRPTDDELRAFHDFIRPFGGVQSEGRTHG